MAEYIKKKDIGLTDFEIVMCRGDYKEALKMLLDKIENLPAADEVGRKKGKWETAYLDHEAFGARQTVWYCSECHQITSFRTFFCPNCGADMR